MSRTKITRPRWAVLLTAQVATAAVVLASAVPATASTPGFSVTQTGARTVTTRVYLPQTSSSVVRTSPTKTVKYCQGRLYLNWGTSSTNVKDLLRSVENDIVIPHQDGGDSDSATYIEKPTVRTDAYGAYVDQSYFIINNASQPCLDVTTDTNHRNLSLSSDAKDWLASFASAAIGMLAATLMETTIAATLSPAGAAAAAATVGCIAGVITYMAYNLIMHGNVGTWQANVRTCLAAGISAGLKSLLTRALTAPTASTPALQTVAIQTPTDANEIELVLQDVGVLINNY